MTIYLITTTNNDGLGSVTAITADNIGDAIIKAVTEETKISPKNTIILAEGWDQNEKKPKGQEARSHRYFQITCGEPVPQTRQQYYAMLSDLMK